LNGVSFIRLQVFSISTCKLLLNRSLRKPRSTLVHSLNRFYAVGVSFKKTDLALRNKFALNEAQCAKVYAQPHSAYLQNFFILSTCNRTEIYGFAPCEYVLTSVLQHYAKEAMDQPIDDFIYVKEGEQAVKHFFQVAAGLDSQIPGDYEIISQVKASFQQAKELKRTNGYLEKLFNFSLQASKEVKNTTSFSDGTLSVPFSVVQQLSMHQALKEVSVLGAGETGELTIKYLRKFLPEVKINLINRNSDKLKTISARYQTFAYTMDELAKAIRQSDALIVTTNAEQPLVKKDHIHGSSLQWIYDLSVPQNVAPEVYALHSVSTYDIDTISKQTTDTLQNRLAEIPKVEAIIDSFLQQFTDWSYRHHYFSIADQAGLSGSTDKKTLHTVFKQWQKNALTDSSMAPYSEYARQSMLDALKNNFPETILRTEEKKETHYYACITTGHAQQPACFMANQCCRIAAH
jgi:glutamyl-tRNA reductase